MIVLTIAVLCLSFMGIAVAPKNRSVRRGKRSSSSLSTGTDISDHIDVIDKIPSVSSHEEKDVVIKFHDTIEELLDLYTESLITSLKRKDQKLRKFLLIERGVGEADMLELAKEWATASWMSAKDRIEFTHKRVRAAIVERWRYGRREGWRRNPFVSGQRPNHKEEDRRENNRAVGRLHHLRDDRDGQLFFN